MKYAEILAPSAIRPNLRHAAGAHCPIPTITVDFDFVSAPIGTSTTDAAELGTERNGTFC